MTNSSPWSVSHRPPAELEVSVCVIQSHKVFFYEQILFKFCFTFNETFDNDLFTINHSQFIIDKNE
jgi:hypothetical protein